MALKFASNAKALAEVYSDEITQDRMRGWAFAGLIAVMKGDFNSQGDGMGLVEMVKKTKLQNGSALNVGNGRTDWGRGYLRNWHHWETFTYYTLNRDKKGKNPEVHAGMYVKGIREAGGTATGRASTSLNYISTRLKEQGYIKNAWRSYQGTKRTKEELAWEMEHGIAKLAMKTEKEVEE